MGSRHAKPNFSFIVKQLKCTKMYFDNSACTKVQVGTFFIFLKMSPI